LVKGLKNIDNYYYFTGQLNEWPALQGLLLVSITKATAGWGGLSTQITRVWNAKDGKEGKGLPAATELGKHCRATFWAPSWSRIGWSPTSPGFVFWYSEQHDAPRLLFGSEMLTALRKDATAYASVKNVHVYVHRYPVEHETVRDKQTYHALALVEWEHGLFTTVLELAFLNAIGGYGGKSNWVEDKLAPTTKLFQKINEVCPGMVQPWNETRSEIRVTDVPMKNTTEFEAYLHKYSNNNKELPFAERRFIDPARQYHGKLKLRSCTAEQLGGFLLNYIQRVWGYRMLQYNCQTFAVDLFAFLTGARNLQPYSNIIKAGYKQHIFSFLYEPSPDAHYGEQ